MNLQTKISLQSPGRQIHYDSEMIMIGSCFAQNIGSKFEYYKFRNVINPFGILFHPKAIETFLWMATQDETYTKTDVFKYNEQWHCFDAHSSLSNGDSDALVTELNDKLSSTKQSIGRASHIFITLGTSWVYRLKEMDMIVANCHKIPQKEFAKELLSIGHITQCLQNCIHLIRGINQKAKIAFTVSPVRHAKDGFVENTRSKSHLIAAIHNTIESDKELAYFPAYELMMDELRDYRFYDIDMLHPNELAVQYLWERFSEVWITETARKTMKQVEEIQKGLHHIPFNRNSKQHNLFLEKLYQKTNTLKEKYPFMDF